MTVNRSEDVAAGASSGPDSFANWLLEDRHGGNPDTRTRILNALEPVRDAVISRAQISPGDTVIDIGCGDGMVGLAVLDYLAGTGKVIFSDPSAELLARCQHEAGPDRGPECCAFEQTALPGLDSIKTASVDAALTRAVIMYVAQKRESFEAIYRILRPGGRISIYEPISSILLNEPREELYGYDVRECAEEAAKIKRYYVGDSSALNSLVNFDERDLLQYCEDAGFTDIQLDLHVDVRLARPNPIHDWQTFLRTSPNPTAPPVEEAFHAVLDEQERQMMRQFLEPQLKEGIQHRRFAVAFLRGVKPAERATT